MLVVYFDIDTLRSDRLGCYGGKVQTPHLDKIAQDGVRFSRAYAANTPCMPSRANVFTGRFGAANGVLTHGPSACTLQTPPQNFLPYYLATSGVKTVTVSSFGRHPAPWFYQGFCEVHDPSYEAGAENFQRFSGRAVNDKAMQVLRTYTGENLFLHLHYWDPHGPLSPPQAFIESESIPDTQSVSDAQLEKLSRSPLYRGGQHMAVHSREDLQQLLQQYEAEIRFTDALVGEILNYLQEQGLYHESCILVSADHGEQYGEGEMILEHGTVQESCIRIPLLCKLPDGEAAGTRCIHGVYNLDIAPTVAACFGVDVCKGWDGVPLQTVIQQSYAPRPYLVCEHGLYTCQRAVVHERWKLIHTYHSGVWEFPAYQLFDLQSDPYEQKNVAQAMPHILQQLLCEEQKWLGELVSQDPLRVLAQTKGPYGDAIARRYGNKLCKKHLPLI